MTKVEPKVSNVEITLEDGQVLHFSTRFKDEFQLSKVTTELTGSKIPMIYYTLVVTAGIDKKADRK